MMLALALVGTVAVNAQKKKKTLTKEITVETDFVPVEQKAVKANVLPTVSKTVVPKKTLNYTEWVRAVEIPHEIRKFEPYAYNATYPFVNSKGYADFGIGSQLNVLASAGYKFIDEEDRALNAWFQHNSTWLGKNSSDLAVADPLKQKINDNTLGVNFANKMLQGTLKLGAYFHYDGFNYFGYNDKLSYNNVKNQSVIEVAAKADWESKVSDESSTHFLAQVEANHFGYSRYLNDAENGLQENRLFGKVNAEAVIASNLSLGIDGTGDIVRYSNVRGDDAKSLHSTWLAVVKGSPYVRYNDKSGLNLKAGISVDLSAKDGKKIRISPNVRADFKLYDRITAYGNVSGGKKVNYLSEYHTLCRYLAPSELLGSSYSTIDAEAGLKIGPFSGFYARPFIAYGVFKNELFPFIDEVYIPDGIAGTVRSIISPYVFMQKLDIKGWKAGLELGYKYNDLIDLNVTVEGAKQDNDKGYVTGLDRAKLVANAQVTVTPIKPLAVTVGYEMRSKRAYYSRFEVKGAPPVVTWRKSDLRDVSNLKLQASYQVNDKLAVFVHGNNLFNQHWDEFMGIGSQKLSAMAGINVVF